MADEKHCNGKLENCGATTQQQYVEGQCPECAQVASDAWWEERKQKDPKFPTLYSWKLWLADVEALRKVIKDTWDAKRMQDEAWRQAHNDNVRLRKENEELRRANDILVYSDTLQRERERRDDDG